ncbi:nucleotidyltransferase domain-containing protein [Neobacillus vireti]|uniref:nucleotidyltransferase domain-containing protein n=1 Tax=Neobacillus vireti TaxID=220686 RepID=UPI002FFF9AD6
MKRNASLNLTLVPEELKLILEIIRVGKTGNKQIHEKWKSVSNNLDWDLFLELAIHHRLYPILYSYLKKVDTYSIIPCQMIKKLSQLYKINTLQMLQLRAEMDCLGELLTKNQIRILFLKGPVLGSELYGDLSLRTSCDLDFLVPIGELKKTEKVLMDNGYEKDDYIKTVLGDWKWRHHHLTYHNRSKNIKIEVHWRLNPGPGSEPNFSELWERKRRIKGGLNSLYYLGLEDLLFFLITHGARHGWSRLRWLMDIDRILETNFNWQGVQLLDKYGYKHVAGQTFILSSQLLNTNIPFKLKSFISGRLPKKLSQDAIFYIEKMVELHSNNVPEDIAKYHKRHLISLMSYQQKLLFKLSYLYPYPTDIETLPLPKSLHFLYFLLRPFLWLWRKTRKHTVIGGS